MPGGVPADAPGPGTDLPGAERWSSSLEGLLMAAFRAETQFSRDPNTFTPTKPTVAVILGQITGTLPM